jgi:hypothetical protein
MTFELYFGAGVRELIVYDHITKWLAVSGHYHETLPSNLPDHKNRQALKASVNFGINLSFDVHKRK